ncbi:MAG: hypothetical protein U9Q04_02070 [Campylobacterota bacterium]|nr:hypothetical protein [Campylobacterota bacterium]
MIIQINKNLLFTTFGVASFEELETALLAIAPSMVEYYLSDLASTEEDSSYINRSNIQHTISLDEYSIYLDYNDDTFLEFVQNDDNYETQSLW